MLTTIGLAAIVPGIIPAFMKTRGSFGLSVVAFVAGVPLLWLALPQAVTSTPSAGYASSLGNAYVAILLTGLSIVAFVVAVAVGLGRLRRSESQTPQAEAGPAGPSLSNDQESKGP